MKNASGAVRVLRLASAGAAPRPALHRLHHARRPRSRRASSRPSQSLPSPEKAREFHRFLTASRTRPGPNATTSSRCTSPTSGSGRAGRTSPSTATTCYNSAPRQVIARDGRAGALRRRPSRGRVRRRPGHEEPARQSAATSRCRPRARSRRPLVYARGGNPEDYDVLEKHGIDVRGKVVIVRYSNPVQLPRVQGADRRAARARRPCSSTPTPPRTATRRAPVFPDGPWGPETPSPARLDHLRLHRARRSAHARAGRRTEGARRIRPEEAQSVPKIMAAVMSWHDAKPLLEQMDGPEAPKDWQGGLPITYRLGGGRVKVHLKVDMDNSVKPELRRRGPAARRRPARRVGARRQPPRRLGVRRRRSIERHRVHARADPCAGRDGRRKARGRAARSSRAAGTARRWGSPDPPSGASSSPPISRASSSPISTSIRLRPARISRAAPSGPWRRCSSRSAAPSTTRRACSLYEALEEVGGRRHRAVCRHRRR